MDSLSQAVLGASVACVIAPRGHRRKALLVGAALGTLPDLDVFIDYGDAVKNFTYHRGFSHSLFVLFPTSLLLWLILRRFWAPVRNAPLRWLAAISLALITHPLLDAHTAYGTQLFWPMTVSPTMWATMFIIDPLYTLPLVIGVIAAAMNPDKPRNIMLLRTGIVISTLYLGWSWIAQSIVERNVRETLSAMGVQDAALFSTPTPFNTLLWRIVIRTEEGYFEGFDSLLVDDDRISFRRIESDTASLDRASDVWAVARLRWFSQDFVKADVQGNQLIVSDLRMGSEPTYVFSHIAATRRDAQWQAVLTEQIPISISERDIAATWQRIWTDIETASAD